MRRRLILSMTAVTAIVLLVAGIPLVIVVDRLARSEASLVLRRQAEAVATDLATDVARGRAITTGRLLDYVPEGDRLVVETPGGTRVEAGVVLTGSILAVDVEAIGGIQLRLETSAAAVERRISSAMWSLGLLALAALGVTTALASVSAQRIAEPLDRLAESASRLGAGDFSELTPRAGMDEIDMIAAALDTAGARIAALVDAERQFSANASHQLRTAVTGLRLRLEGLETHPDPDVADEARAAVEQADRLTTTIDDLLRLARTGRAGNVRSFDLVAEARLHAETARPRATRTTRAVRVVADETDELCALAAPGAFGQALDVLLDNAITHGRGDIEVRIGRSGDHLTVAVTDEGALGDIDVFDGPPRADGHGIGLGLARSLVRADGGRLDLVSGDPTSFCITVPSAPA